MDLASTVQDLGESAHVACNATNSARSASFRRFRVEDRPGIIAKLAGILASKNIGLEAVLQEPCGTKHDLPFVITTEQTSEQSIGEAIEEMSRLDFMREAPLALPLETAL